MEHRCDAARVTKRTALERGTRTLPHTLLASAITNVQRSRAYGKPWLQLSTLASPTCFQSGRKQTDRYRKRERNSRSQIQATSTDDALRWNVYVQRGWSETENAREARARALYRRTVFLTSRHTRAPGNVRERKKGGKREGKRTREGNVENTLHSHTREAGTKY